jgi:DNA-binding NarL/FixJ family response regulator
LIKATIDAGAAGFIPKTSTQDILIAALKLILAGGVYIPNLAMHGRSAAAPHRNGASDGSPSAIESLSKRQLEVLARAVQGKPNKVIARELYIAEGTVKAHLSAAFQALGVSNRTEAVYAAAKLRLIQV